MIFQSHHFSDRKPRPKMSVGKARVDTGTNTLIAAIFIASFFGFLGGAIGGGLIYYQTLKQLEDVSRFQPERIIERETIVKTYIPQSTQEQKIIDVVQAVSPAVVSIMITKDVPIIEQFFADPFEEFFGVPQFRQQGTEKREVGGGSGFFISPDGLLVTNKHVVLDDDADYTVFTNEGRSYPAEVLARDPVQDLAVLKIEQETVVNESGKASTIPFPFVNLGNSDRLEIGQTVIAIGNALGEFRNTVSVGVISGLGRTITASDGSGFIQTIEDVIQTDAAINRGNSGGPLLNLSGEVIGVNTATVLQAQSIGFAIPSNKARRDVEQVQELGKIVYAFLGVRYALITENLQQEQNLPVDYGVLIGRGSGGESAIFPGSAAEKAGFQEGDIILEFNGEKITTENSLAKIIQKYNPGDTITLKIMRSGSILTLSATLGERSE